MVSHIARKLTGGESVDSVRTTLRKATFRFSKTDQQFQVLPETGEHDLGLLRMQLGGGVDGGLFPLPTGWGEISPKQNFARCAHEPDVAACSPGFSRSDCNPQPLFRYQPMLPPKGGTTYREVRGEEEEEA